MTNQEIITRGELIRDEIVTGANTAQRVGEAFVGIGENLKEFEDDLSSAVDNVNQISGNVSTIRQMFSETRINGSSPSVTTTSYNALTKLTKQSNGEYGFAETTITNPSTSNAKLYGLSLPTDRTSKDYSLAAFVLDCDSADIGDAGNADNEKLTLHYTANALASAKNIKASGKVVLDNGNVLVYIVSNKVTYNNVTSLPYTTYIRMPKQSESAQSFTFGIVKALVLDIDAWDEETDLPILIDSAQNSSQRWYLGDAYVMELSRIADIEGDIDGLNVEMQSLSDNIDSLDATIGTLFTTKEKAVTSAEYITGTASSFAQLTVLGSGEYGIAEGDLVNGTNYGKTWGVCVEVNNNKTYNLAAAVITGIDIDDINLDNNSSVVAFNATVNNNVNNRNAVYKGKKDLGNGKVLVYVVSGTVTSQSSLPNYCGVRVPPNTTFRCGIEKVLMVYLDEWDDADDLEILKASAVDGLGLWKNGSLVVKEFDSSKIANIAVDRARTMPGIAFWGSSTTAAEWIKTVAEELDMPYYWGGVGGESIRAISSRMGSLPMFIKDSFTIPASASSHVAFPNQDISGSVRRLTTYILKNSSGSLGVVSINIGTNSSTYYHSLINPCYIAGVKGNILIDDEDGVVFQREEDGVAVTTNPYEPVFTYGFQQTRDCVQFLACHYNGGYDDTEDLVAYYKRMYDISTSKKVLILGRHRCAGNGTITTPLLATCKEEELALQYEFGLMFLNIREWMCTHGVARAQELGTTLSQTDLELAGQGVVPDAFYVASNNVHFNTLGYQLLAEAVIERMVQLGYDLYRAGGEMVHPNY